MNDINILAVIAAAVASFACGALWYSPLLFIKAWTAETGLDPSEHIQNPAKVFGLSFVFTLVSALAMACWLGPNPGVTDGVVAGLIVGVCLVMTSMGINYQFAGRSTKFWLIDGGFHVLRFAVIGLVLGVWP